jgi:NADH-quinone oxidoreductase subunit J
MLAAINWHSVFFLLFSLVACAFALAVMVSNNIVRMAFYLVISLGAAAGLFFLAGAEFVGAMQLLIYVGGTLVLLVFGVMLTAQTPFITMKTRGGEWILGAIVGGALLVLLIQTAFSVPQWRSPKAEDQANVPLAETKTSGEIGLGLLGVRTDKLREDDPSRRSGMSGYLLPFEIVSVHLLVVLIGAAYLARSKRRVSAGSAAATATDGGKP